MRCLNLLLLLASAVPAATVDGLAIHYSVAGAGPATVIFVHGGLCDETVWSEQASALSASYRIVTIDLPGHGKSGTPAAGKSSMDLFARSVDAVRAELKAGRIVLAGHSAGTPVIVQYTRLYPDRVIGLIIVDGRVTFGPKGPGPFDRQAWLGEEGRKARERFIDGMFVPSTNPDLKARIRTMMMTSSDVGAADARAAYYDPAIWKDEMISFPTLAIYAQRTAASQLPYIKEHFSKLDYHEISDAGHFLMLEKPAEFNLLVLDFLSRIAQDKQRRPN